MCGLKDKTRQSASKVCHFGGFAFVLPTSTPAMAMVFGVGYLRSKDTIWGALVAFASLIVFAVVAWFWWPIIGISVVE